VAEQGISVNFFSLFNYQSSYSCRHQYYSSAVRKHYNTFTKNAVRCVLTAKYTIQL